MPSGRPSAECQAYALGGAKGSLDLRWIPGPHGQRPSAIHRSEAVGLLAGFGTTFAAIAGILCVFLFFRIYYYGLLTASRRNFESPQQRGKDGSVTPSILVPRRGHGPLLVFLAMLAAAPSATTLVAAEQPATWDRPLPWGAKWALARGIDLPNPFGGSLFVVTMTRDIEVSDVRVTLPDNEPASIGDVANFAVRNSTTLAALKADAWIFPVLNLYVLAGQTWTDSKLDVAVTIDRVIGDPVVLEASQDSEVGGPLLGAGATLVAGHGPWFVLADANYNYSDIDEFEGGIAAWFLSARTGWSGATRGGGWRAWVGAAYLKTDRTLTIRQNSPELGTVVVEVDQRPVDPLTYQVGGSLGIGKRWELLLEAGSNFDDAFVGVLSASFRF